jgi:hypothetical protein
MSAPENTAANATSSPLSSFSVRELIEEISRRPYNSGVTMTELIDVPQLKFPLAEDNLALARELERRGFIVNLWGKEDLLNCYDGAGLAQDIEKVPPSAFAEFMDDFFASKVAPDIQADLVEHGLNMIAERHGGAFVFAVDALIKKYEAGGDQAAPDDQGAPSTP